MFQSVSGVRSTSNAIKHMHVKSYVSISHSDISGEVLTRGGGAYERGGDAHRKFWIRPLKETNLGVAQTFFWPLKAIILNFDYMKRVNKTNWKYIFLRVQPKKLSLWLNIMVRFAQNTLSETKTWNFHH